MARLLCVFVSSVWLISLLTSCSESSYIERGVVHESEYYSIYSADSVSIRYVSEQMDIAVSRFAQMFDANPPYLSVVVVSTPGMMSDAEYQQLGLADEAIVLPILPERFDRTPVVNVYGLPDKPLILSLIAPAKATTVFRTGMDQFQKRDTIRSLNRVPIASIEDVISIYEDIPVGATVRWTVKNNEEREVAYIRSGAAHALPPHSKSTDASEESPNRFVAHEAGHMLHQKYAADRCHQIEGGAERGRRRQNGKVGPDWLDEMVASLLESPDFPTRSVELLQNRRHDRIPLSTYFEMEHPLQRIPNEFKDIMKSRASDTQALTGTFSIVVHRNTSLVEGQLDLLFYAQTHAFGQYIHEHEGIAFVGEMSRILTCGGTMNDVLPTMRVLPTTLPELEKHWDKWLASHAVPTT